MKRRREEGIYIVTGPGEQEKRTLTIGAGISTAQSWASKHRKDAGTFTFYVRDVLGTTTYATVTKEEDGVIVTRPKVAA